MKLAGATSRAVAAATHFRRGWNMHRFRNVDCIPVYDLLILRLVYTLLSFVFTTAAVGFFLRQSGIIRGAFVAYGSFCIIFTVIFFRPRPMVIRALLLVVGAFFGGASLCHWIVWSLCINPGFMVSALVGISLGFQCYWTATLWARNIGVLYYSGMYLSIPVILLWMIAASSKFSGSIPFWKPHTLWEVYITTMSFMLHAAIHSYKLLQRIQHGDKDYVWHAIDLLLNIPGKFRHHIWTLVSALLPRLLRLAVKAYRLYGPTL